MHARPPEGPAGGDGTPGPGPWPGPEDRDPRFAPLVAQIAARLRPVCAGWDEARLQALAQQIARRQVHWGDAYRTDVYRTDAYHADASGRAD